MADRKISDLTALTTPAAGDYLPIIDISEPLAANKNKRITIEELLRGAPDGTAAAPSFAFESDGGNGFYLASTDTIGASTNGVNRLTLSTSALTSTVPISATSFTPTSSTVPTNGLYLPAANSVALSTNGTGRLFVDASGNVSVGGAPQGTGGFSASAARDTYAAGIYTGQITAADTSAYNAGPVAGFGFAYKYDASGNYTIGATIHGIKENATDGNYATALRFTTRVNGSDVVERLRITSTGQLSHIGAGSTGSPAVSFNGSAPSNSLVITSAGLVGIGTSSPDRLLHLSSTTYPQLRMVYPGQQTWDTGVESTGFYSITRAGQSAAITVDTSNRVGIGTTTFSSASGISGAKLQVLGGAVIGSDGASSNGSGWLAFDSACAAPATTRPLVYHRQGVGLGLLTDSAISFEQGSTERARIDSSGRLLVGTSSARSNDGVTPRFLLEGAQSIQALGVCCNESSTPSAGAYVFLSRSRGSAVGTSTVVSNGDTLGGINFYGADGTDIETAAAYIQCAVDGTPGANDMPGRLVFSVSQDGSASPTERFRLENTGRPLFFSSANGILAGVAAGAGTTTELFSGIHSRTSTTGGGSLSVVIYSNGNVLNTNNSYTAISDIKLKENVVDAGSQWADLKALRVRNYNLKEGQTHRQIGLIAQEVEPISPGLVYETPDRDADGNDLGTTTKAVQYSVLYMKAVKALQEAMERIETLEAKVAALETK